MVRRIILLAFLIISFIVFTDVLNAWNCKTTDVQDIKWSLETCLKWSTVIQSDDLTVSGWFKTIIINFIKNISIILALAAIWFIAYGSMFLVASWWNDEKIKKWKNIIMWSLIWFAWLVSASWLIAIIVNLIYWI